MKSIYGAPWVSKLNLPALILHKMWPYLFSGACFGAALALLVLHACGCGPIKTPPGGQVCGSDFDCPDGWGCGFIDVDTRAICIDGTDTRWDVPELASKFKRKGARRQPTAAHCTIHGLLPDPICTPGAVATTDMAIVCGQSTRQRRIVPVSVHIEAFEEYGLSYPQPRGEYEIDHLIPLELGGSNDIANLWAEAAPGFHRKDVLENAAHRAVCAGELPLQDAQRMIANDWTALETLVKEMHGNLP